MSSNTLHSGADPGRRSQRLADRQAKPPFTHSAGCGAPSLDERPATPAGWRPDSQLLVRATQFRSSSRRAHRKTGRTTDLILFIIIYWRVLLAILVLFAALIALGRLANLSWGSSLALIPAALAASWIGYSLADPWHTYSFRLTVNLNVDGETVSKSEVYQAWTAETPLQRFLLGVGPLYRQEVIGEAIYFDIGQRPFVVTMAAYSQGGVSTVVLPPALLGAHAGDWWASPKFAEAIADKLDISVPLERLPDFITFLRPQDPNSLRLVDRDSLSGPYRHKVAFSSASLAFTSEPPGRFSLLKHFAWLRSIDRPFPSKVKGSMVSYGPIAFRRGDLINGYF